MGGADGRGRWEGQMGGVDGRGRWEEHVEKERRWATQTRHVQSST